MRGILRLIDRRPGLFALLLLAVALVSLGARNFSTSGAWVCAGACTIPDSDETTNVTSITLGTPQTTTVTLGGAATTTVAVGAAVTSLTQPENNVGPNELGASSDKIIICGQDANSGTIYFGPETATYLGSGGEFAIGGAACNALDNATEATADAPITAGFPAFKVTGMHCVSSSDATNDQVLTLRSAAADVTPSITCTIAGTGSAVECTSTTATTTDIASGATIAVKSVNTEDLSAQDIWCEVYISF